MIGWLNPWRWLLLLGLAASLWLGYHAWVNHIREEAVAPWRAAVEQQKKEARDLLANETAKVKAAEQALADARKSQDEKDRKNESAISELHEELRRNSRAAGGPGLRDPWSRRGPGCSGAISTAPAAAFNSAADAAEASGVLSAELEGVLLRLASEADEINAAYESCRADAKSVRGLQ